MKSHITWKGVLISLSILILFVGTFSLATGGVSIPNIFKAGDPAKASEVNANFAAIQSAINDRQTASDAALAADYYVKDLQTWKKAFPADYLKLCTTTCTQGCNCTCSSSFQGTLSFTADGKVTGSGVTSEQCACTSSCCLYTNTVTITGTYTVTADGAGSMTLKFVEAKSDNPDYVGTYNRTLIFQASKDLNTLMYNDSSDENSLGMAMRK